MNPYLVKIIGFHYESLRLLLLKIHLPLTREVSFSVCRKAIYNQAFPLTEIPLPGEMSEGQKGAVSGEEKVPSATRRMR